MVRPANFGFNEETAASNAFQSNKGKLAPQEVSRMATAEFDSLVEKLRQAGIEVIVVEDTEVPVKTDAVFPNNWFTTHGDGTLITYPMLSKVRRLERRADIIEQLADRFHVTKHLHLEKHEEEEMFLEGTGSLVLDRPNRIAYACRSPRTHPLVLEAFCTTQNYHPVSFRAVDAEDKEIYHTNVVMALGDQFVVICLESIVDRRDREQLIVYFRQTQKELIEISFSHMSAFAGNMLQLKNAGGQSFLVMSERAFLSLHSQQIEQIEKYAKILHSPLEVIETYGGGSARCMIAEVFLPA